ncbi:MAG: amino acid adenylation domain-containing protein, partial [Acidobacteriota bacterium]
EARERGVLSFGQRRLWVLARLEPDSAAYNMPFALHLRGALDHGALERALDTIVHRHEILRTRYVERDGEPQAVADPPVERPLDRIEIDSDAALDAWLDADARRPFDLERGPVVRPHLLRRADDDHLLVVNVHHIAFDGWSYGVLRRELAALYEHFVSTDVAPERAAPTVHYADHAARQHVLVRGERLDRQVAHWRERLAGLEPLDLPADRPRPDWLESPAAAFGTTLPADLSDALRRFARGHDTTLFTTLLAGFDVLLHGLTGRTDFAVGVPDAGRHRSELEDVLGFFVDNLVLRADLDGDPRFTEVVERVQSTFLDAREHAEVPFEKLVEELQPDRHIGRNPFFDVSFQVLEAQSPPSFAGLRATPRTTHPGTAKFDLTLDLVDPGDGPLRVEVEWAAQLFDRSTVERWLALFASILDQVVAEPRRRLSTLDLLIPSDVETLAAGHRHDPAFDPSASLPGLVATIAAERAEHLAASYADGRITYRQLDHRARLLAAHLGAMGVHAGDRVGVCLPRSVDWPTVIVGIGYAGAAYVPLDPEYPLDRLRFMAEDAKLRAIVGRGAVASDLCSALDHELIDVGEAGWPMLERHAASAGRLGDPPPVPVDGAFPAYVIYTSGSTGRPKGVVVPHRGVVASVLDPFYDKRPDDVMSQSSSPSFDVAAWEMWSSLATGGTLVGIRRTELLDLDRLAERLEAESVNCLELPGALFDEIARGAPELTARARFTTTGGDRCDPSSARAMLAAGGRPINAYGPTETSINATVFRIDAVADDAVSVPIGHGVREAVLRVLDPLGRPVPVGVAGELCVGGPIVADGYLDRPARTAGSFVPDPLAGRADGPMSTPAGARLYRTGDRVRWLPSGILDFLGRIDDQVKIRGFRVEPGEIEALLARHAETADVAVAARAGADGLLRLLAWAAPIHPLGDAEARAELAERLRRHLGEHLPDHMVPAVVQVLDELPHTPNGKIDRRALPDPDASHVASVAPRTAREAALASIWSEVLGVDEPSVTASFFELGGHSLLATRLLARVRDQLGVDMPLRLIFEKPTIEALALALDGIPGDAVPALITREHDGATRPLTFGQERLWFLDRLMPESPVYNIPFAQRLTGPLDHAALERAVGELLRRHEALRSRFPERDGQPEIVIEPPPSLDFGSPVDLSDGDAETRAERLRVWLRDEAATPFDLTTGPVMRPRIARLADDEHVLSLCVHHIVADGGSLDVLGGELKQLYAAFQGDPEAASPLAEPAIQLADVATWQREWLQGDSLDRLLGFWRDQLDGLLPTEVPTDHPRPAVFDHAGATRGVPLDARLGEAARALGRRLHATPFHVFLAAFDVVLQRFTGHDEVTVGSLSAGRDRTELLDMVGFLVHTQVLRTDCSGDPSFAELVGRVRETSLRAQMHQEMPFEKLVEALDPVRDPSRHPFFQIAFQYLELAGGSTMGTLGAPVSSTEMLSTEMLSTEGLSSKFDLSLAVGEIDGALRVEVEYATRLFEPQTVDRVIAAYCSVLDAALADPDRPIGTLPVLPPDERRQLLVEWNRTVEPFPRTACLLDGFRDQVEATPDAEALITRDGSLTYAELWSRVDALAGRLEALDVGPEVPVVVCLDRRAELIVSLLAVLEAGGVYVPVDPSYPRERVGFTLDDSGARAVITRDELVELLPAEIAAGESDTALIQIDPSIDSPRSTGRARPLPENLAYLIYTSGSTGRPKGVAISHRSAVAMVTWAHGVFSREETAYTLGSTSVCFDLSVYEIFVPLSRGD